MPFYDVTTGFKIGLSIVPTYSLWAAGVNDSGQLGNNTTVYYSSPIQIGSMTYWSSIATGSSTTIAIKTDGTLWGWGSNLSGQLGNDNTVYYSSPIQIGSLTNWKQVTVSTSPSAGISSVLAIKTDGTLWGWGSNVYGQLGNNSTTSYSSPIQIGSLNTWSQISCAGQGHTFAIKTDGTLWGWGRNNQGQLGNNIDTDYSSPVQIGALNTWKQVTTTRANAFAIRNDGTLWGWGTNNSYQLCTTPNNINYSSPIQIGSLSDWSFVSAGGNAALAIKTNNTLWGWGDGGSRQLGNGTNSTYSSPIQIGSLTDWQTVSVGGSMTYAIKFNKSLWVWGINTNGELGLNNVTTVASPVQAGGGLYTWNDISRGNVSYAFAIAGEQDNDLGKRYITKDYLIDTYPNLQYVVGGNRKSPGLWACGYNPNGQLGLNNRIYYSSPVQVGSLTTWRQVSGGLRHTAAITTDGKLYTWGLNTDGRLGSGTITSRSSPVQVGALTNWRQVSASHGYASSLYGSMLAIKSDGTLWAWGDNTYGQLGNNISGNAYSSPIQIGALTNWKQVVFSNSLTATAIKTDGTLWTWGNNADGQLGRGNIVDYSSPIQVGSLNNWKQLACGYNCVLAIKTNGTLWGWGSNLNGTLGLNNNTSRSSPTQIGSMTNWKQVAAYDYNVYAIKTDGTLWGWGNNGRGQLATGTNDEYSSPIQIGSLTNWKNVTALKDAFLAIKTDGSLWGCGYNQLGQLGAGTQIDYGSPIQIGNLTNWKQVVGCGYNFAAIQDGYI